MKDPIETALEKLKPEELKPELMARLTAARSRIHPDSGSIWRKWFLPLATGVCAGAMALAYLYRVDAPGDPVPTAAAEPMPFERNDYLLGTREVGVFIAPNQRPYRVVEIEWLEQDTVRSTADGSAIRLETTRREVVPVAMEIF